MPTTLGNPFPITWAGIPPHMSKEDLSLWRLYQPTITSKALRLYFDVGLGGETTTPPGTSPEMSNMWLRNTQKRADVVIELLNKWIIVELRAKAHSSAVGRLLMYHMLWNDDPPDLKPVELIIVTDVEDKDTRRLSEKMGIKYIVF